MIKLINILKEIRVLPNKITLKFIYGNNNEETYKLGNDLLDFNIYPEGSGYIGNEDILKSNFYYIKKESKNTLSFLNKRKVPYKVLYGAGLYWIEIKDYKKYFNLIK